MSSFPRFSSLREFIASLKAPFWSPLMGLLPTPNMAYWVPESGILFSGINGNGFTRNGGGVSFYPADGGAYLQALAVPPEGLVFRASNDSLFGLVSVDLAEYSTVFPLPLTVQFIGYYMDGSTVTTSFTTDGIIDGTGPLQDFQTFLFPNKEWSGLKRVEIPTSGWSLDN